MRFLPTRIHGAIDYLWGALLVAAPFALGFADAPAARWTAIAFGVGAILYAALTDYELGLVRLLSMPAHLALDALGGLALAVSPWALGFADRVFAPHVAFGLFALVASMVTRTRPGGSSGVPG